MAKRREEVLAQIEVVEFYCRELSRAPLPDFVSLDQQAGIVAGLQQEADVPRCRSFVRIDGGLFETEAELHRRSGQHVDWTPPFANLLREAGEFLVGSVHCTVRRAQRVQPLVVQAVEAQLRAPMHGCRQHAAVRRCAARKVVDDTVHRLGQHVDRASGRRSTGVLG